MQNLSSLRARALPALAIAAFALLAQPAWAAETDRAKLRAPAHAFASHPESHGDESFRPWLHRMRNGFNGFVARHRGRTADQLEPAGTIDVPPVGRDGPAGAVPEPSSFLIFATAALAIAHPLRRKRASKS